MAVLICARRNETGGDLSPSFVAAGNGLPVPTFGGSRVAFSSSGRIRGTR